MTTQWIHVSCDFAWDEWQTLWTLMRHGTWTTGKQTRRSWPYQEYVGVYLCWYNGPFVVCHVGSWYIGCEYTEKRP